MVAAHDRVDKGFIDGALALSFILWPSEAVEAASDAVAAEGGVRRGYSDEQRLRALELVDAGRSWAEAGRELGLPKTTVGAWVRKRRLAL